METTKQRIMAKKKAEINRKTQKNIRSTYQAKTITM